MIKPVETTVLDDYIIRVKFNDGVEGEISLQSLVGKGVFKIWENYEKFKSLHIGKNGELQWTEDIELCPDSVYLKITNKKASDLFSNLKETAHA